MLLDKSGLRQKPKSEKESNGDGKKGGGFKQKKGKKLSPEEARKRAIEIADKTGIGYDQYKKEVDMLRTARIREQNELKHKNR